MKRSLIYIFALFTVILFFQTTVEKTGRDKTEGMIPISINGEYSKGFDQWHSVKDEYPFVPLEEQYVYIRGHFSQDIPAGQSILFLPFNIRGKVWLNGEEVLSFGWNGIYTSRGSGQEIYFYQSPGITTEDVVEMELGNLYHQYSQSGISSFLSRIAAGREHELYAAIMNRHLFGLGAGILTTLIGLVMLGITFAFCQKQPTMRERTMAFSFFSVSGGLYVISDAVYPYMPLFVKNPLLCNLLDVVPVYLIVLSLCMCFGANIEVPKLRKAMDSASVAVLCVCISCFGFHVWGWADLYETQLLVIVTGGLGCLLGLVLLGYEGIKMGNSNAILVLCTFLPVVVAMALEAVNRYLSFDSPRMIALTGVLLTVFLQLLQFLSFVKAQE